MDRKSQRGGESISTPGQSEKEGLTSVDFDLFGSGRVLLLILMRRIHFLLEIDDVLPPLLASNLVLLRRGIHFDKSRIKLWAKSGKQHQDRWMGRWVGRKIDPNIEGEGLLF
jgi:hypothetical protein